MPLSWTDAGEAAAFVQIGADRCAFRTDDLLRLSQLLSGLVVGIRKCDK